MSFVVQNSPRLFNFDCVLKPEVIEGAFKKMRNTKENQTSKRKKKTNRQANKTMQKN